MFYLGCPMWGYKGWVGTLFPAHTQAGDFLRLYSQKLTCVEGNTTFYSLPASDMVARWRRETPEGFRFCPKLSKNISHSPGLGTSEKETLFFIDRMRLLGQRLGPIFLQLPPTFAPAQLGQLAAFLAFWPENVRLAVEVRHPGFYSGQAAAALNALLSRHHVARVMMDTRPIRVGPTEEQDMLQARERKPDLPLDVMVTTDFVFVRYIGHPRMQENEQFLAEWAERLASWFKQGLTLYVFCHCPFEEHSPAICVELYKRVRALAPVPHLPWNFEREESKPEQISLFD